MSVSRGKFLKDLGKSLPGMVLGGGMAKAAQTLLAKVAAVSDPEPAPIAKTQNSSVQNAKIDFITSGPSAGNRIALTFDDGPTPGVTEFILDALKQRQLRATFFMIGNRIAAAPELARRVLAEGHEVGNHTFTHAKLTALSDSAAMQEIQKTQEVIQEVLNLRAAWFRPPYGALRQNQAAIARSLGLRVLLWSVDAADWSQPGEAKIIETVLAETKPGSIIICHDLHQQTVNALPSILDGLCERGFIFSTVSDLLSKPSE
jgi:peptidoglycan/xylan/chitin deacetylase (PgdA/CDA1 family)